MKKRIQGVFIGILIYSLILGCVSVAANLQKEIDITYRDIKLRIDGDEVIPRNAVGTVVEPFIYDGTTYLPVRAVSEALGRNVNWDGETSTVIIKDKELRKVKAKLIKTTEGSRYHDFLKDGDHFTGFFPNISFAYDYNGYPSLSFDKPEMTYELPEGTSFLSGTLMPIRYYLDDDDDFRLYDSHAYHMKISTLSGKILYNATVTAIDTEPIDFEIFTKGADKIVISFSGNVPNERCMYAIKNLEFYGYC